MAKLVEADEARPHRQQIQSRKQQDETLKAPATSQVRAMPKPKPKSSLSALEALRARRVGFAFPDTASAPPATGLVPSIPAQRQKNEPQGKGKGKGKTKESDSQIPTQPLQESTLLENQTRSTAGKLQTREGGVFPPTRLDTLAVEPNNAPDDETNGMDELMKGNSPPTERNSKLSTRKGALKTPKQRELRRSSVGSSAYDLVESPESMESAQPDRGTAASKKKLATNRRSLVAPSASRPRRGRATRVAESGRASAPHRRTQRDQSGSEAKTRKGRMKAESNIEHTERPETSTKAKQKTKATPETQPQSRAGLISEASKSRLATKQRLGDSAAMDEDGENRVNMNGDCQDDAEDLPPGKPKPINTAGPVASKKSSKDQGDQGDSTDLRVRTHRTQAGSRIGIDKQRAKTPIVPRSSPPVSTAVERAAGTTKKPTIISFGKAGPQNQGSSSARKVAEALARTDRFSVPPQPSLLQSGMSNQTKVLVGANGQPSLLLPNENRRQSDPSSAPTSVARDVTNAFASFMKTSKSPVYQLSDQNEHAIQPRIDDDEFVHIDEFDSTTMMAEEDEGGRGSSRRVGTLERTRSQLDMPPPPSAPKTLELKNTEQISLLPENRAHELRSSSNANRSTSLSLHPPMKRAYDGKDLQDSAPKRSRASIRQPSGNDELLEASTKPIKSLNEQRKPVSPTFLIKPAYEPFKSAFQKPKRERSHGSQKVDMQGSPIPPGMVVQAKETVLEQFSHQAELSPDEPVATQTLKESHIHDIKTNVKMHPLPAPWHQAEPMSSNKKRKPSGPEDESRGVTKVIKRDHHQRLVVDEASAPSTDPFTSGSAERKQSGGGRSSSALFVQLEEQIQHETVARLREHLSAPQIPEEAVASLSRNPFKQPAHKHTATGVSNNASHHDPEKTLVERKPDFRFNLSKRAASISTVSSDSSVSPMDLSGPIDDVNLWRSALEPHQMNLFDGLVIVSHKLVRHLVDQETVQNDIADDYKRRGMNVIEQMELRQAKAYQDVIKRVKSSKKHFHRELIQCSKALQQQVADIKTMGSDRKEAYASRETLEARLQSLMAQGC